jgi:hypothetical protein
MPRFPDYVPHGVIPATLLALRDDFTIDEQGTAAISVMSQQLRASPPLP